MRYELSNKGVERHPHDASYQAARCARVDDRRVLDGIFWGRCRNLRQRPLHRQSERGLGL